MSGMPGKCFIASQPGDLLWQGEFVLVFFTNVEMLSKFGHFTYFNCLLIYEKWIVK